MSVESRLRAGCSPYSVVDVSEHVARVAAVVTGKSTTRTRWQKWPRVTEEWRSYQGGCQVCPHEPESECDGPLDLHHVVPKRVLKRYGLEDELWNTDNRIAVCRKRHAQIENRFKPLPYLLLPFKAVRFAERHGLGWYLRRFHP